MPVSLVETRFPSSLLWRQDFIVSGKCKLKAGTHMGKLAPTSLVATRFHLVEGMCKLKTRTHMGKLAPIWESWQHV